MALKAYKEQIFNANIKFDDGSVKEVEFRLPRNTDVYKSEDGNTNLDTLYTFANMAKPFKTPIQVEAENGSILNIDSIRGLIELGVTMDMTDVVLKWYEKRNQVEAEKERIVKKSKSAGNSTQKDIQETKD